MKRLRVGLNGFGRIGRAFTRIALDRDSFDIVAVNTRKNNVVMMAYLLHHDSVYRTFHKKIGSNDDGITVGNKTIHTLANDDPSTIPWGDYDVDVVVDATGAFTKKEDLEKHIRDSVKKVILTAPSKDDATPHIVIGVNDYEFPFDKENVISNASCTTNCTAPMFKVLNDNFKIRSGYLTTTHAYTASQTLVDDDNKEPDRSRAAAINIAPSTTGAAKAVGKVVPDLLGKIDGMAVRVPVPTVSFSDVTCIVDRPTTREEVNELFWNVSKHHMKGVLAYEEEQLVSSDFIGSPYSVIFDSNYTKVVEGTMIKIFGWYDNEWGYSTRLVDLVEKVGAHI